MGVARTNAVTLLGLRGSVVEIEADISDGIPGFFLIGLPDTALREAVARVKGAAGNSELPIPNKRITVNLSPAALPKHGSGFDLAIAMATLAAAGFVEPAAIDGVVHLGELGLDGRTRPIDGILPAVHAAARAGFATVVVPTGNAEEAALVPGIEVRAVASLRHAAILHGAEVEELPVEPILRARPADDASSGADLADVIGNPDAVEAMVVAAAGAHHVLMLGPPGAGKTMLAARLPGLLPDLEAEAALEASSIRSLSGLAVGARLTTRPPFEAPHHTASAAAIIGGGTGVIRPGAAARAAHGVLFLDEAPEFSPSALDTLRQPLESGEITIHRSSAVATFPARFQLLLAANPCPCGQYGATDAVCTCPPMSRRRYLSRLSGPLLDRIDIQLPVRRITAAQLRMGSTGTTTAEARSRVAAARDRCRERLAGTPWRVNAQLPGAWLRSPAMRPPFSVTAGLDRALERGAISMRGYDRVLRIAWTLADIDGVDRPGDDQVGRARAATGGRPVSLFGLKEAEVATLVRAVAGEDLDRDQIEAAFARAAWSGIAEPGDGDAGALIGAIGPADSLRALLAKEDAGSLAARAELPPARLRAALERWHPKVSSAATLLALRQGARFGVRLLTVDIQGWPAQLDDLGPHTPIALWTRGTADPLGALARSVSIVGARAATGYGEHVTSELAGGLSDRGFAVVSGGAYGIDGMAHRATLAGDGTTIAFLAGGPDRFYPAGHESLLRSIVGSGVVITELPCGFPPTRWRFLTRNRLIAAASQATVVVEAGSRSGSLNTAHHAAQLGRPLGAVPGPVTSPASTGCHRLIREGLAECVTSPDEVVELIEPAGAESTASKPDHTATRVLDALSRRSGRETSEIARRSGLSERDAAATLGRLELDGRVSRDLLGWRRATS